MNVVRAGALANSSATLLDESSDLNCKTFRKRITGHYIEGFNLHPIVNTVSHSYTCPRNFLYTLSGTLNPPALSETMSWNSCTPYSWVTTGHELTWFNTKPVD